MTAKQIKEALNKMPKEVVVSHLVDLIILWEYEGVLLQYLYDYFGIDLTKDTGGDE